MGQFKVRGLLDCSSGHLVAFVCCVALGSGRLRYFQFCCHFRRINLFEGRIYLINFAINFFNFKIFISLLL